MQYFLFIYTHIFFFLKKALLFPFCPQLGKGLRGVKKLPHGRREKLRHKPWHQREAGGAKEAAGLQRLLVTLGDEPSAEMLAQLRLGARQAAEASQEVARHLGEFQSSSGKWLEKAQRWGLRGQNLSHTDPHRSGQAPPLDQGGFTPLLLGWLVCKRAKGVWLRRGICVFEGHSAASHFSVGLQKWPAPSRSTPSWWKQKLRERPV